MEKMRNLNDGRTFLSEFYSNDQKRTACVYHGWQGYSVDFLVEGKVVEHRSLWEHTRQYAEDACENWVTGVIK